MVHFPNSKLSLSNAFQILRPHLASSYSYVILVCPHFSRPSFSSDVLLHLLHHFLNNLVSPLLSTAICLNGHTLPADAF